MIYNIVDEGYFEFIGSCNEIEEVIIVLAEMEVEHELAIEEDNTYNIVDWILRFDLEDERYEEFFEAIGFY